MRCQSLLLVLALTAGTAGTALALPAGPATGAAARPPTHVNRCWSSDNGGPVVDSLEATPSAVDASSPTLVRLAVRAHDTGGPGPASGVGTVQVNLNPTTQSSRGAYLSADLHRGHDGLWHGAVTVPAGTDAIFDAEVSARDKSRRKTHSAQKAAHGVVPGVATTTRTFTGVLTVTSTLTDTTPPTLVGLSVSSTRVNTRKHARMLTVTATAADDASGVSSADVGFRATPWPGLRLGQRTYALARVAGTDKFRAHVRVPRWVGDHTELLQIGLVDRNGNDLHLGAHKLRARGLPSRVRVVSSALDRQGPRVLAAPGTSGNVDVRKHGRWFRIRLLLADPQGVSTAHARLADLGLERVALHRVSGSPRRGTWSGRLRVPWCVLGPVTTRLQATALDRKGVRNDRSFHRVHVRSRDHVPPHNRRARWHSRQSTFEFSEAVHGISSANVEVFDNGTIAWPAPMTGSWTCRDRRAHRIDCLTGPVFTATFTPDDTTRTPGIVDWEPPHHLDVLDAHGNPFDEPSLSAATID